MIRECNNFFLATKKPTKVLVYPDCIETIHVTNIFNKECNMLNINVNFSSKNVVLIVSPQQKIG